MYSFLIGVFMIFVWLRFVSFNCLRMKVSFQDIYFAFGFISQMAKVFFSVSWQMTK